MVDFGSQIKHFPKENSLTETRIVQERTVEIVFFKSHVAPSPRIIWSTF